VAATRKSADYEIAEGARSVDAREDWVDVVWESEARTGRRRATSECVPRKR
jgi:hypothetical protein